MVTNLNIYAIIILNKIIDSHFLEEETVKKDKKFDEKVRT